VGFAVAHLRPDALALKPMTAEAGDRAPLLGPAIRTALTWAAIWAAPMALIFVLLGRDHVLFEIGLFFSKLAMVTFGGAYAVLTYMAQEAVSVRGWLSPGEMVDGLGLAETTPGPLILVTQFVGFLAAFRLPAPFTPLVAGLLGAAVTLWTTFAPCFMWIFTFAPSVERLEHARRLQGALAAITAAVVGVIANLTLWFGLHVLFQRFEAAELFGRATTLPDLSSFDWRVLALGAVSAVLLFRLHLGVIRVLGAAILLGLALHFTGLG
jgi:chromate transporter